MKIAFVVLRAASASQVSCANQQEILALSFVYNVESRRARQQNRPSGPKAYCYVSRISIDKCRKILALKYRIKLCLSRLGRCVNGLLVLDYARHTNIP